MGLLTLFHGAALFMADDSMATPRKSHGDCTPLSAVLLIAACSVSVMPLTSECLTGQTDDTGSRIREPAFHGHGPGGAGGSCGAPVRQCLPGPVGHPLPPLPTERTGPTPVVLTTTAWRVRTGRLQQVQTPLLDQGQAPFPHQRTAATTIQQDSSDAPADVPCSLQAAARHSMLPHKHTHTTNKLG
eukprot:Sspe_Gene.1864::Locus_620_Transcript_12_16_Confidence_0.316_Length_934::g.1864::m.1864